MQQLRLRPLPRLSAQRLRDQSTSQPAPIPLLQVLDLRMQIGSRAHNAAALAPSHLGLCHPAERLAMEPLAGYRPESSCHSHRQGCSCRRFSASSPCLSGRLDACQRELPRASWAYRRWSDPHTDRGPSSSPASQDGSREYEKWLPAPVDFVATRQSSSAYMERC